MNDNPYESPDCSVEEQRPRRRFWRFAFVGSCGLTLICFLADQLLRAAAADSEKALSYILLTGLFALGQFAGIVLMGIFGIGWVLNRGKARAGGTG